MRSRGNPARSTNQTTTDGEANTVRHFAVAGRHHQHLSGSCRSCSSAPGADAAHKVGQRLGDHRFGDALETQRTNTNCRLRNQQDDNSRQRRHEDGGAGVNNDGEGHEETQTHRLRATARHGFEERQDKTQHDRWTTTCLERVDRVDLHFGRGIARRQALQTTSKHPRVGTTQNGIKRAHASSFSKAAQSDNRNAVQTAREAQSIQETAWPDATQRKTRSGHLFVVLEDLVFAHEVAEARVGLRVACKFARTNEEMSGIAAS